MSVARPARSLVGRCLAATPTRTQAQARTQTQTQAPARTAASAFTCRQFHSSAPRPKQRPRFRNVKAQELGLLEPSKMDEYRKKTFPEYTQQEQSLLKAKYTPEQLEAIMAGEAAIDPEDLIIQGRLRDDGYRPAYIEDYTVLDPRYDVKPELEDSAPQEHKWLKKDQWIDNYGMKMAALTEKKTSDQLSRAMLRALRKVKSTGEGQEMIDLTEDELVEIEKNPELLGKYILEDDAAAKDPDAEADEEAFLTREQALLLGKQVDEAWKSELDKLTKFGDANELQPSNLELLEGGPAGSNRLHSAEAVELGKVPGVAGLYNTASDPEDEGMDDGGSYQEIKRLTGMTLRDILSTYRKVLVRRSVVNQTRLGKVRSIAIIAIAGNGNGRLGLGIGKSTNKRTASEVAQLLAIRNMKPIRRYEKRTVFGNPESKVSGTIVQLFNRPPGFGLRCPHRIFEMCRASGIHDISARLPRSRNPMNSVKAAYYALTNQPDPEEIAIGRGKKMVDVRKVYYGGSVQ